MKDLQYKIRRLKSELESKYPKEASIKEREKEMREMEINPTDLVIRRERLAEQLVAFAIIF